MTNQRHEYICNTLNYSNYHEWIFHHSDEIKKHTGKEATINATWINRIDDKSNDSDDYHRDETDLSFIYYPTNSFNGGELECIVNNETINKLIITNG